MATAMTRADSSNGSIVREGFGESSIERRGETASTALAAQAQAEIQARYVVAMRNPRDDDNVRAKLLRECQRPNFAKRAFYSIPRGDKPGRLTGTPGRIEGLSIRFAEAAIRISGNILQVSRTTYDDDYKRMVNIAVTDLETNAVYSRDVVLEKTVERSRPKDGAVVLGQRTNSQGKPVFIVQTTDDELIQKESLIISKVFRTEALRLVPADTLDECEQMIVATVTSEDARDPDAARKEVADAFVALNVMPSDLKEYLGHDLAQCSPAQLSSLRGLYAAIRSGDVTWAQAIESVRPDEKTGEIGESLDEKIAKAAAEKKKAAPKPAAKADAPPPTAKPEPPKDPLPVAKAANDSPAAPPITAAVPSAPCLVCHKLGELAKMVPTTVQGERGVRHTTCDPASVVPAGDLA